MIGYSGSGYKGMQLNNKEKTIEGDLFQAFVAAGAVSKANADDPKKVSLIRCARTDKGVHAAGNIISLKLIIDDRPDLVERINENLSPQIRVWGIERTMNSFSAYSMCDSRIYEYFIPTHCFIPPHPRTHLGRMMPELATEMGDLDAYQLRQEEVASFWEEAEARHIKPVLAGIPERLRERAMEIVFDGNSTMPDLDATGLAEEGGRPVTVGSENTSNHAKMTVDTRQEDSAPEEVMAVDFEHGDIAHVAMQFKDPSMAPPRPSKTKELTPLEAAVRKLKEAYMQAKRDWRIPPARLARVKSALGRYVGVKNYHNYTVKVPFKDKSAIRVMKSFVVEESPIIKGDTEWLSCKVHGQSFMMHQIRKMISMAALIVRCGTHEGRFQDSFQSERISIPKAPGLGLLLERPIFDGYNKKAHNQVGQAGAERKIPIGFDQYDKPVMEFKQREIYERMWREEEAGHFFHQLFWALDTFKSTQYLYLSSKGMEAVEKNSPGQQSVQTVEAVAGSGSDEEEEAPEGG